MSFVDIGKHFNVSADRVTRLYRNGLRRETLRFLVQANPDSTAGLSVRAANVLWNMGITSKLSAVQELRHGKLAHPDWKRVRNLGKKTYMEICRWAGQEWFLKRAAPPNPVCPHCGREL
jgi:hypothetical protein